MRFYTDYLSIDGYHDARQTFITQENDWIFYTNARIVELCLAHRRPSSKRYFDISSISSKRLLSINQRSEFFFLFSLVPMPSSVSRSFYPSTVSFSIPLSVHAPPSIPSFFLFVFQIPCK